MNISQESNTSSFDKINRVASQYETHIFIGFIVLWLAISLPSLLSYPVVNGDEPLFGAQAYNLLKYGSFSMPLYGDIHKTSQDFIYIGRFYTVALSGWFLVWGVSLMSARLFSVAGALLCALLVWRTGRKLATPLFALLAAGLSLFAWKVLYASHRVRPDIWIAVVGALVLYLYFCRPHRHFALGVVAGLLLNVHLPVVFFILATSVMKTADLMTGKISLRSMVAYTLGLALGLSVWAAFLFLPDPARTLEQIMAGPPGAPANTLTMTGYSVTERLAEFVARVDLTWLRSSRLGWLELATYCLAVLSLLVVKGQPEARSLLLFTLALLSGIAASQYFQAYYWVMTIPLFSLLVASTASSLAESRFPWAGLALSAPLLLAYIGGDIVLAWNSRIISYTRYADAVAALVPPNASILDDGAMWFEFPDHPYTHHYYLYFGPESYLLATNEWIDYVLEARGINIVLQSERMATWGLTNVLTEKEILLHDAITTILVSRCKQLGVVEDYFYGVEESAPALKRTEVWECPT